MSSSFVPIRRKSVDDGEQEVESTRVIIHDGYNLGGWLVPLYLSRNQVSGAQVRLRMEPGHLAGYWLLLLSVC